MSMGSYLGEHLNPKGTYIHRITALEEKIGGKSIACLSVSEIREDAVVKKIENKVGVD